MKKLTPKSISKIPVKIDFENGRSVKKLEEILNLKKGTTLKLEDSQKDVISIYINNKLQGYGKAKRKNGMMYVELTDLIKNK